MKNCLKQIAAVVLCVFLVAAGGIAGCGVYGTSDSGAYTKGVKALKNGDLDTAMTEFRTAVDQNSRVAEAYRGEGLVFMKQGNYESAATVFERSLSAFRRSGSGDENFEEDVEYYLAEAYTRSGDIDQAMSIYAELTSGKTPDRAFLLRGMANIRNNDIDAAMDDFDHVVANNPSYENCLKIYEALSGASHKADGADYLKKCLSSSPESADDYYYQGLVYNELGNSDKALDSLNTAMSEGSKDAYAMYAKISIDGGKTDQARKTFNEQLQKGDNLAAIYNGLALCDIADQEYDDALDHIQEGLNQNDEDMTETLRFNEVVVYERQLDFSTAESKLKDFLESWPDNAEAKREYQFLQTRVSSSEGTSGESSSGDTEEGSESVSSSSLGA